MTIAPSELRAIPLFAQITDEHLKALMGVFEHLTLKRGEVLFEAGDTPTHFLLLVDGEVALREAGETRFRLRPIAPIGELGSLTGLKRSTSAVVMEPAEVWRVPIIKLMDFFETHGNVAFPFYHNLLKIVADKVRRDVHRLDEMRANIIRTQKKMKGLRELILESEETVISKPVFETLDDLIEHNRRWHYMVEPAHTLQATVRLDDGQRVAVKEMSDTMMRIAPLPGTPPALNSHWSGVLVTPNYELPVGGMIEASDKSGVLVQLDRLVNSEAADLEDYLTRLQMLDFVV